MTPFSVAVLGFPAQIASATGVFSLAFTSAASVTTHLFSGTFMNGGLIAVPIAIGMLTGAQLGPRIAQRVGGALIVRLLAVALLGVSARMISIAIW